MNSVFVAECHRFEMPYAEEIPMALPHHNNEDGSVEGTFIFHSPQNANVWFVNITFMPKNVAKSVLEVIMYHSHGDDFMVAMCEKDDKSDWTINKNLWSNSSHLNSSHNITLQVRCRYRVRGTFSCGHIRRFADTSPSYAIQKSSLSLCCCGVL